jgi:hypothetical protein
MIMLYALVLSALLALGATAYVLKHLSHIIRAGIWMNMRRELDVACRNIDPCLHLMFDSVDLVVVYRVGPNDDRPIMRVTPEWNGVRFGFTAYLVPYHDFYRSRVSVEAYVRNSFERFYTQLYIGGSEKK